MKVDINGEIVDIDLSLDRMTFREAVMLEEQIGVENWDALVSGKPPRPTMIGALVWVKLRSAGYDVAIDDFDFDLADIDVEEAAPGKA